MHSRTVFFIFVCLFSLTTAVFAAKRTAINPADVKKEPVTEKVIPVESAPVSEPNEVNVPAFPYVAEITGEDVLVRSGPGTEFYTCGKLNKADRVTVVCQKTVWAGIIPPAGSFSWISVQYVKIDPNNPGMGIVSGTARVYAGSDYIEPIHSETLQLTLNNGDKVRLLGEEKDDYYKIVPPANVYLWVSTQYIKPLSSVGEVPPMIESAPQPVAETNQPEVKPTIGAVPAKVSSVEAETLKEYYELEKQVKAEKAKPLDQQNYEKITKSLSKIAGNKAAGKATRYAEFTLNQVKRFELALEVTKAVQLQDNQLKQTKEQIENARVAKLAEIPAGSRFVLVGQLQPSIIYGPEAELRHYRIVDDAGKTVCYALPIGSAAEKDWSKLIGHKVGLVGTVEPHPQTAGVLVKFTEIEEVK